MKKLYLLSSGDYFLTSEVLLRLDLLHGEQWNTRHLRRIQPEVVKPLLLYWYGKKEHELRFYFLTNFPFSYKSSIFISSHFSYCNYEK